MEKEYEEILKGGAKIISLILNKKECDYEKSSKHFLLIRSMWKYKDSEHENVDSLLK